MKHTTTTSAVSPAPDAPKNPTQPETFDLAPVLAVAAAPSSVALLLDRAAEAAQRGAPLRFLWPAYASPQLARATTLLRGILALVDRFPALRVQLVAPLGDLTTFLGVLPGQVSGRLTVVVPMLGEEATLRFRRDEPGPVRRLANAVRLAAAGWPVMLWHAVTPTFDGWRQDVRELLRLVTYSAPSLGWLGGAPELATAAVTSDASGLVARGGHRPGSKRSTHAAHSRA